MEKDELVLVDMIEKLKNDEISYFKDPTQDKQNKILDSYNPRGQIPEQIRLNFGGKRRKTIKGRKGKRSKTNKRKRS